MEQAVSRFFRLQLSEAGRQLDQAYVAVLTADPPRPQWQWALAQRVRCTPLVADAAAPEIQLQFEDFYAPGVDAPLGARIRLAVHSADDRVLARAETDLSAARQGYRWDTGPLEPGDHVLVVHLEAASVTCEMARVQISRVADWQRRLAALEQLPSALAATGTPTGIATLEQLRALLCELAADHVQERDVPAHHLLATCESLLTARGDSRAVLRADRPGDYLLTLSDGTKQLPVRLRVPDRPLEPLPVLLAFHGAGGSENMFFETYGAGRLVELAAERGWLVVAPRQSLFGLSMDCDEILAVLAEHFPVDHARVFLVGHSMGAAQVVQQVSRHADKIAAAVALGGGRAPADPQPLARIPWFVAAGERDFGRRGAEALARSLADAGAGVRWRVVPHVEHLVMVQAALDDVFAFLDEVSPPPVRAATPAP
ncbi:MAG: alpha/beta fold hydrolase [Pirellulaceae bacterium]|jgi:predicted esterase|nr:alpha/beta fold hydrolase [Pirellulaceae bacterium]